MIYRLASICRSLEEITIIGNVGKDPPNDTASRYELCEPLPKKLSQQAIVFKFRVVTEKKLS